MRRAMRGRRDILKGLLALLLLPAGLGRPAAASAAFPARGVPGRGLPAGERLGAHRPRRRRAGGARPRPALSQAR